MSTPTRRARTRDGPARWRGQSGRRPQRARILGVPATRARRLRWRIAEHLRPLAQHGQVHTQCHVKQAQGRRNQSELTLVVAMGPLLRPENDDPTRFARRWRGGPRTSIMHERAQYPPNPCVGAAHDVKPSRAAPMSGSFHFHPMASSPTRNRIARGGSRRPGHGRIQPRPAGWPPPHGWRRPTRGERLEAGFLLC